jgi:alpha-L-arabinofuranosidase
MAAARGPRSCLCVFPESFFDRVEACQPVWAPYDIRIEVAGRRIKCYLAGWLIRDVTPQVLKLLYASASHTADTGEVILKVVNTSKSEPSADIKLNGVTTVQGPANAVVLTSANPADENSLTEPTKVAPATRTINVNGPSFRHARPGNSVTILG